VARELTEWQSASFCEAKLGSSMIEGLLQNPQNGEVKALSVSVP